jgi:hypothetical protein
MKAAPWSTREDDVPGLIAQRGGLFDNGFALGQSGEGRHRTFHRSCGTGEAFHSDGNALVLTVGESPPKEC